MAKEQAASGSSPSRDRQPRLCHMHKGDNGYGFHLHGEKGKSGQFIRKVEPDSPAEAAGLRAGDRVVEVNGLNVEKETHHQVRRRGRPGQGDGRSEPVAGREGAAGWPGYLRAQLEGLRSLTGTTFTGSDGGCQPAWTFGSDLAGRF